jgi:hypothetical protein
MYIELNVALVIHHSWYHSRRRLSAPFFLSKHLVSSSQSLPARIASYESRQTRVTIIQRATLFRDASSEAEKDFAWIMVMRKARKQQNMPDPESHQYFPLAIFPQSSHAPGSSQPAAP